MVAVMVFGKERANIGTDQTIEDAMRSMNKFPDAYLFLKEGRPVPMTSIVSDGDIIEAVRIASGG